MNKTKEEAIKKFCMINNFDELVLKPKYNIHSLLNHFTDQIKSLEGEVKELRDEAKMLRLKSIAKNKAERDENILLKSQLESLQKENKELIKTKQREMKT
jgi:hypothetical protein